MLADSTDSTTRQWRQRERGMCSDADCDEPIEGWCADCDALGPFKAPKLCAGHLLIHCAQTGHTMYSLYACGQPREVRG